MYLCMLAMLAVSMRNFPVTINILPAYPWEPDSLDIFGKALFTFMQLPPRAQTDRKESTSNVLGPSDHLQP